MGGGEPEIPAPEDNCQILGEDAVGDPVPPFKKANNGLWDQGTTEACGYYALINGNIAAGANDAEGAFEAAVRACLAKAGVDDAAINDGLSGEEMDKIAKCKEEKMRTDGTPVTITSHSLIGLQPKLSDLCEQIKTALAGGGSATVNFMKDLDEGHALRVTGIDCTDEENPKVTFSDPNDPTGPNDDPPTQQYEVVVDCEDLVSSVMPDHEWLKKDFAASAVYIEVKTPPAGGGG